METLKEMLIMIFGIAAFTFLVGYGIFSMAESNINERAEQKAACIASGGKYAESQKHNATARDDYCIGAGGFKLDYKKNL